MSYETTPLPYISCAYMGCGTGAVVRLRSKTGWAQLCEQHYAQDNVKESREYCKAHGLDTTEKKIAHCRALFRKPRDPRAWMQNPKSEAARQLAGTVAPVRERVPGEDLEEDEAEEINL